MVTEIAKASLFDTYKWCENLVLLGGLLAVACAIKGFILSLTVLKEVACATGHYIVAK